MEARSDSATKCGICDSEAFAPQRFSDEDAQDAGGVFNECGSCGAECTGTGAYTETDRYYWTGAAQVAQGRAAMEAAQADAEWAEDRRYNDY
jgi:hypothetical protein